MSITLYREGLPRVDILSPVLEDREGMLVGLADMSHGDVHAVHAVVMGETGGLHLLDLNHLRIQFHYDAEGDDWIDENKAEPDRE